MGRFFVYSERPSNGARALAKALGGRRVREFPAVKAGDVIINWGDSKCPSHPQLLNSPSAIRLSANKLTAFDALRSAGVSIPDYAKRTEDVHWEGVTVVRHKLTGHSGEGIEIVENRQDLPNAPLYVRYVKKEDEYRIHMGKRGTPSITIIAVQRKARRKETPDSEVNWQVRNHANGFVFVRQNVSAPECVIDAARDALICSGLDFGAVDVIYNRKEGKAYVLEINTAPGLEGTTVDDYANFFRGDSE
jgi:glutathione synthase/RimK-type ligase-like ATP-grasp enzyme